MPDLRALKPGLAYSVNTLSANMQHVAGFQPAVLALQAGC